MSQTQFLWECFEDIAEARFYIETEKGEIAKSPAFLIYEKGLYLNGVGKIASFRSKVAIWRGIKELVENANYPMRLWRSREPRKNEKPFAINYNYRNIPENPNPEAPIKAFNIKEWEK